MFDRVTPHDGIRHATVAGSYAMTLDLANAIHRQIYMGCFANAMTRWAKALLRAGRHVPRRRGARRLLLADCGRPRGTRRTRHRRRAQPRGVCGTASAPGGQCDRARRSLQLGPGRAGGIGRAVRASRRELSATTTRRCFGGRTGRPSRFRCGGSTTAWTTGASSAST